MTREIEIINLLLDRYERSGHCLPGRESGRRVMLHMGRGDYEAYRENDPSAAEINRSVQALAEEGLLSFTWRKGYENWLLGKVYLNLEFLEQAYARVKREPLALTAATLLAVVQQASTQIQTPWKLQFLEDEIQRLQQNLRPSRLLPKDATQAQAVIEVLQYTENGSELMRVISANCFHDSKYLERTIVSSLASIAKAYDPELVEYRAMGNEYLTQNVALRQLGILTCPEIMEFCGKAHLLFSDGTVASENFQYGFCLHSDNMSLLNGIEISEITTILFVENRTNYRHLVLNGVPDDALIIYHGGFYSPAKHKMFRMLTKGADASVQTLFWGDIDLGGFLMFGRLKKELFPQLVPWNMGLEEFEKYQDYGLVRSQAYLGTLQSKVDEGKIDPALLSVAQAIIKKGVTVEQEIMI